MKKMVKKGFLEDENQCNEHEVVLPFPINIINIFFPPEFFVVKVIALWEFQLPQTVLLFQAPLEWKYHEQQCTLE